jgi:hypothetical protein
MTKISLDEKALKYSIWLDLHVYVFIAKTKRRETRKVWSSQISPPNTTLKKYYCYKDVDFILLGSWYSPKTRHSFKFCI